MPKIKRLGPRMRKHHECSFCFKSIEVVKHLIASPREKGRIRAFICDECVPVASKVLEDIRKEEAEKKGEDVVALP